MVKFLICSLFIISSANAAIQPKSTIIKPSQNIQINNKFTKTDKSIKIKTNQDLLLEAEAMRKNQKNQEALDLLEKVDSKNDDINLKKYFELALNNYNMKQYRKSLSAIDSFLEINTKTEKKQASGEKILITMKNNILTQNPNIKERNKKIFNASLGASYMHDSNPMFINSTTDASYYSQLNLGSYGGSDYGQNYQGSLGYNYEFKNSVFVFGSASGYITKYNNYTDKNSSRYSLLQGVGYKYDKVTLSMPFQYTNISLNRSSYYSSTSSSSNDNSIKMYAINPSIKYDWTNWLSLTTIAQFMHKKMSFSDEYNNKNIGINEQVTVRLIDRVFFILYGGVANEHSTLSQYSYSSYNVGAALRFFITKDFYIDPNVSFQALNYKEIYSSINEKREDRYNNYGIGAHYIVSNFIDFYINYTRMNSSSNVSLYEYKRNVITGGITLFY